MRKKRINDISIKNILFSLYLPYFVVKIHPTKSRRALFFRYTNKKSKIHEMCRIMIETLKKSLKNKQKFAYFLKHMIEL